jgi:AraC family transcriptional regulator of arabinose operon
VLVDPGIVILNRPGINHCEPHWKWTPPRFSDFDLWVVLAGSGTLRLEGSEHSLKAGSCVIFQPGDLLVEATQDPSDRLVVFYCHFIPATPQRTRARRKRDVAQKPHRICDQIIHATFDKNHHFRQDAELIAETFEQGEGGKQLALAMVAKVLAHAIFLMTRPRPRDLGMSRFSKLALDIRSKPGWPWDVKKMAARCAISPPHFNRQFQKVFGFTPIQYVIRQRIIRATALLKESDLSIKQIASAMGYRDVFFFHRQFRQIVGKTPGAVRSGGAPGRHA